MTKRGQKTESAIIHATTAVTFDAVDAALREQRYFMDPDSVARTLAARLRDPSPTPELLQMLARWLDPDRTDDDPFKLVLVHRRDRKRWTTAVNDIAIVNAVMEFERELIQSGKPKHGIRGRAVRKVAKIFKISEAKVRKTIRAIPK